jgi:hypothetical protein
MSQHKSSLGLVITALLLGMFVVAIDNTIVATGRHRVLVHSISATRE